MKAKTLLSGLLIVFVAVSLVYLVVKENGKTSEGAADNRTEPASQSTPQVVAYYFHGFTRCKTCLHMESEAKKAIENAFPDELKNSRLVWKVVNFEESENVNLAQKYQLVASSIIIAEFQNGQETRWKNLDKIWDLVWDDAAYGLYVQDEVRKFLNSDHDNG